MLEQVEKVLMVVLNHLMLNCLFFCGNILITEKSCRKFSDCAFSTRRHPSRLPIRVSKTPPCSPSFDFSGNSVLDSMSIGMTDSSAAAAEKNIIQMGGFGMLFFSVATYMMLCFYYHLFPPLGNAKMSLNKECLLCRRVAGNSWYSWSS